MRSAVATPLQLPRRYHWTREEYYRLVELGWFENRRVQLIYGEIVEMPPQKNDHAWCVSALTQLLLTKFGPRYTVRPQLPLHISDDSEPEPDIAVVEGAIQQWRGKDHPSSAVLVIEISQSTLAMDRQEKAALYASAGIAEYWIVNLVGRQLEVHRQPVSDAGHPFGFRYDTIESLGADKTIAPLALPQSQIAVADLLP